MGIENILGYGIAFIAKAYFTKEPLQLVLPNMYCETVYNRLKQYGFYDLGIFSELTRKDKIWSLAKDIGNNYELHVRALKLGNNHFNVSSHVDIGPRHSLRHLLNIFHTKEEQYSTGKKILTLFLS
jgi:hypothetical protein